MKVLVIGLDSAPPELLFQEFILELPNFRRLINTGIYGRLKSCVPAITIPAWLVMMTGKSPGKLGMYGFRHRKGYSYTDIWIANSHAIKEEAIWDILGRNNKKVCLVAIPPSYPPFPVRGCLVSCFITPDVSKEYTYPPELKKEIESLVGEYVFDVEFRTEDREGLLNQVYQMTEKRFKVIKHLIESKPWDFFMFVEIGVDRIQHAFWKFFDREHHFYQPGSKFEGTIRGYYQYLDERIGEVLSLVDNDTAVLVVSDHGAKRMKGAFCMNEWLVEEGYLVLKTRSEAKQSLDKAGVDWAKTKAWGWGGYYARIFLNVEGRERQGIIKPQDYEQERDKLAGKIEGITGPNRERWETKVLKPDEIFTEYKGDWPDLMVYFDDLYWRSAGTIGHNALYLPENDTGPDDAVHAEDGLFILYHPRKKYGGKKVDLSIFDVAPTVLRLMEVPIPKDMEGKPLDL